MTAKHDMKDKPARLRWDRYTSTFIAVPAGPGLREKMRATIGAVTAIAVTGLLAGIMAGTGLNHPLLVAPLGASTILLFAIPASPLAQPWSIVGGNILSALVGIVTIRIIPDPTLAAALAVGLSLLAMSLARCLHPPGGGVALSVVLQASASASGTLPFAFAFNPVGLDSLLLVITGIIFHRISGQRYPHVSVLASGSASPAPTTETPAIGITREDIDEAVAALGETLDISTDDLAIILLESERRALARQNSLGKG